MKCMKKAYLVFTLVLLTQVCEESLAESSSTTVLITIHILPDTQMLAAADSTNNRLSTQQHLNQAQLCVVDQSPGLKDVEIHLNKSQQQRLKACFHPLAEMDDNSQLLLTDVNHQQMTLTISPY